MTVPDFAPLVGPLLAAALQERGFARLTAVQLRVLEPELEGRDLRVTSQTGSGKTVAIGLALRNRVTASLEASAGVARPRALVVVPTRELAKQVEEELSWLYAPLGARVAAAAGGSNARDERRAFARGPAVVVGTPGRMLDHLQRGSIDASNVTAVVLDEADHLLDLGFREDLEAIVSHVPEAHVTHLVSATFPRDVKNLADRLQREPAHVEGTPLGTANADIEHAIYLVLPHERLDALVNLLLEDPEEQTLIFARTRADVAELSSRLADAGFHVRALSGEMEQADRNRALAAFKKGQLHALVATDVAARGLDVQDITRVIHAEPPTDADTYTHRSGRTGRAGRKGASALLVAPGDLARTALLLRRAKVGYKLRALPSAAELRDAIDERIVASLTAAAASDDGTDDLDPRAAALAERILASEDARRAVARLIVQTKAGGPTEPRIVQAVAPPAGPGSARSSMHPPTRGGSISPGPRRPVRPPGHGERGGGWEEEGLAPPARSVSPRGRASRAPAAVPSGAGASLRSPQSARPPAHDRDAVRDSGAHELGPREIPRPPRAPRDARPRDDDAWVPFRVTWGEEEGADARRLLAMVCRRGGIRGSDVGFIQVERRESVVNVSRSVAERFATQAAAPDPREPRVQIQPLAPPSPRGSIAPRSGRAERTDLAAPARRPSRAPHGAGPVRSEYPRASEPRPRFSQRPPPSGPGERATSEHPRAERPDRAPPSEQWSRGEQGGDARPSRAPRPAPSRRPPASRAPASRGPLPKRSKSR